MPGPCPPGTGDLVASWPRNALRNCHSSDRNIESSGEAGRPGLPRHHQHSLSRFHAALGAQAAPAGLENSAVCGAPLSSLAMNIRANVGLLSGGALEAVLRDKASSVHHFWGLCAFGFFWKTKRAIRPKQKKHTLAHFNQQEQPCVLRARSAAVHALPAILGAGFDEQRQPTA